MSLGSKIRDHRTRLNLTQKDLADQLNVTAQAVSRWEQELVEPSVDTLKRMSQIFKTSLDEFLTNTYTKEEPVVQPIIQNITYESKRQLGVCETCNKVILEGEPIHRHRHGKNFQTILCDSCNSQKKSAYQQNQIKETRKNRFWGLFWGLLLSLPFFYYTFEGLIQGTYDGQMGVTGFLVAYSLLAFFFTFNAKNNFIHDFFWEVTSWGFVKMPGVIFSLDFDGLLFLIWAKLLFFFIGIGLAIVAGTLALILSLFLSTLVFPFALYNSFRHPEKTKFI
jgi:transcriptional regulator with XRE-family HTH domain